MKIEKIKADSASLYKIVNTPNMTIQSETLPYIDSLSLGMCMVVLCITSASFSARTYTTSSLDLMP